MVIVLGIIIAILVIVLGILVALISSKGSSSQDSKIAESSTVISTPTEELTSTSRESSVLPNPTTAQVTVTETKTEEAEEPLLQIPPRGNHPNIMVRIGMFNRESGANSTAQNNPGTTVIPGNSFLPGECNANYCVGYLVSDRDVASNFCQQLKNRGTDCVIAHINAG